MRELTKDSKELMCLIYNEYLHRRKNGKTRLEAMDFANPCHHPDSFSQAFEFRDLCDTLNELSDLGLIKKSQRDSFKLENSGIAFMQHRFDRWKDRCIGFVFGVAATVVSGVIINWFSKWPG